MTEQQMAQYPSYGVIEFQLSGAGPERPLAVVAFSIHYDNTDSRRQWGYVSSQEVSRSGNVVSIGIPRLNGSIPASVEISVRQDDKLLGSARVIVSQASNPHVGELSANGQVITIIGKNGVVISATPRLSDELQWRFSGVFLEDTGGSSRTF